MTKLQISIFVLISFSIFSAISISAQTPSQLFQQALLKENGEGNLKAAVSIYEKIVENTSAERSLRAKAQLHIGICWEKMGKQEAVNAYKIVMEQFNDQSSIVQEARERLDKLDVASKSNQINIQPKYKKLADITGWFNQTDCSPNGKWIITDAFRNNKSELWLINLETVQKKRLTNVEIIDFVAQIGFTTKYTNVILKEMKSKGLISVKYKKSNKKRGFYVADEHWNKELATIIFQGGRNGD